MSEAIIERIKKEIDSLSLAPLSLEKGRVIAVGDGIAEIDGLKNARAMEMVLFHEGEGESLEKAMAKDDALYGLVLNLEEGSVKVVILGNGARVREGMMVTGTGKLLSIPVGDDIVGRVVDPLGVMLDGKGAIKADKDKTKKIAIITGKNISEESFYKILKKKWI